MSEINDCVYVYPPGHYYQNIKCCNQSMFANVIDRWHVSPEEVQQASKTSCSDMRHCLHHVKVHPGSGVPGRDGDW